MTILRDQKLDMYLPTINILNTHLTMKRDISRCFTAWNKVQEMIYIVFQLRLITISKKWIASSSGKTGRIEINSILVVSRCPVVVAILPVDPLIVLRINIHSHLLMFEMKKFEDIGKLFLLGDDSSRHHT